MTFYSTTNSQIWMGSLEPYMTELFISNAFRSSGETPQRVKIMRDKNTGDAAGYCFVHFDSEDTARTVLHKLNGKVIPNTSPPVRFKLNFAGPYNRVSGSHSHNDEFTLFVGDLSPEVDDYALYKLLSSRYPSIRTAKVVLDASGQSKGYAFVRFSSEADQIKCTTEMNGYTGLGSKPLKIGSATPRSDQRWKRENSQKSSNTVVPTYDYSQGYYDQAAAWQGYSWSANNYYYQQQAAMAYGNFYSTGPSFEGKDDMALIEHSGGMSVDEMNSAVINRDMDFWDSIEASKWSPVEVTN